MIYVDTENRGLVVGVIDPKLVQGDKQRFANEFLPNLVRSFTRQTPKAVCLLMSNWVVKVVDPSAYPLLRVPPSQHPDRIEMLSIIGASPEGEGTRMARIVRGGEHPELEWEEQAHKMQLAGLMISGLRRAVWG
jgi:hypothetical protein